MTPLAETRFTLKVIDLDHERVELVLRDQDEERRVRSRFVFSGEGALTETMHWYFGAARTELDVEPERLAAAERVLERAGRALGLALRDEDGVLEAWIERVVRAPEAGLSMEVRTDRIAFARLPWELLVLPGSTLIPSRLHGSLRRTLFNATAPQKAAHPSRDPLSILRLVARSKEGTRTEALAFQRKLLRWSGRLRADVWVDGTPDVLRAHYAKTERFPPIVHYQGPLRFGDQPGGESELSPRWLAVLAEAGVRILLIDPVGQAGDEHEITRAAFDALHTGIDHVVTISEFTDGAVAEACLSAVHEQVARGVDVAYAVNAARLVLDSSFERAASTASRPPRVCRSMQLLQHFGGGSYRPFATTSTPLRSDESQALARVRGCSFGFIPRNLPPSELGPVSPHGLSLLADLQAGRTPAVLAARGMGATHAVHEACFAYVLQTAVEAAFYWDFQDELHDLTAVCRTIANALGMDQPEAASLEQVCARLESGQCLLVFENLDKLCEHPSGLATGVGRLLARLIGHPRVRCLLSVKRTHSLTILRSDCSAAFTERRLSAWTQADQLATIDSFARPDPSRAAASLEGLIHPEGGHPFLLRRRLSIWNRGGNYPELPVGATKIGVSALDADFVDAFWSDRYQTLRLDRQRLLAICAREPLHVEAWIVAFDRQQGPRTESVRRLWTLLSLPEDARVADAIEAFDKAGFLEREQGGRLLLASARKFLRAQSAYALPPEALSALERALCETLPVLICRLREKPNDGVLAMLLQNRHLFRGAIERWWQTDLQLAFRTLLALEALMYLARLSMAFPPFALHLLGLPGSSELLASDRVAAGTIWLTLALKSAGTDEAGESADLARGVTIWLSRVLDNTWRSRADVQSQLPLAVGFLQRSLDLKGDYVAYREVCRIALAYYEARGDQLGQVGQIGQLCAWASCEHELGDHERCMALEQRALSEVLYAALPVGARAHVMLDIASARVRRRDLAGAAALLDELEPGHDEALVERSALLRGEIAIAEERWELACERLAALWARASGKPGRFENERIAVLLDLTVSRLGALRFQEIYDRYADGMSTPEQLRGVVRGSGNAT